jgi:hypothetical protein
MNRKPCKSSLKMEKETATVRGGEETLESSTATKITVANCTHEVVDRSAAKQIGSIKCIKPSSKGYPDSEANTPYLRPLVLSGRQKPCRTCTAKA